MNPRDRTPPWRIAYVTETYPPEVNGVALTTARTVQGLLERGHTVQLIRPRQAGPEGGASAAAEGLEEQLLPGLPLPFYPGLRMGLPADRTLLRLWRAVPPALVHIATEGPLGASALRVARRLGLPVCADFRTNFHAYSGHYGLGGLGTLVMAWLRRFHNRCDLTLVPTEALRQELAAAGFARLQVLGRGVDTQRFHPAHRDAALRRRWGAGEHDPVLLYVGRLAAEKNLALFARCWATVSRAHPNARGVVVGDGPLRAALQARHPELVFAGAQRGAALAAHYASADVFVFPSLTETFGNVTPEALASGLAVLAWHHAAAGELIVDGQQGRCLVPGDELGFVAAALQLAGDAALRARLGRAARERVEGLGWAQILLRYEALLRAGPLAAAPLPAELTPQLPATAA